MATDAEIPDRIETAVLPLIMAEILTTDGLFVTDNSACLTRQVETGDISNEEEKDLLSEKTAISEEVITLLDTKVYKGATFHKESILDVQTYYKPTENFYSCHPPAVTEGFIKGKS